MNVVDFKQQHVEAQRKLGEMVRAAIEECFKQHHMITYDDITGVLGNISLDFYLESRGD